jgi:hypothetical protein
VIPEGGLLIGALALAAGGALLFGIGWLVTRLGQKKDDSG